MTDEDLVERAVKGDETAFAVLYRRHREALFAWAWRLTGSPSVAEDLLHDCFVALLKRPDRFRRDRGSQLRTYLFAMARNLAWKRSGRWPARHSSRKPPSPSAFRMAGGPNSTSPPAGMALSRPSLRFKSPGTRSA
jgi:DNA-directed RNA polymerase specialized sigma24 family protein